MTLPVEPPVEPMLARLVREVPEAPGLVYEPKWDGFRCLVFRDGDRLLLRSRNDRPLERYFPELVGPLARALPARCVLDGELVVADGPVLRFDLLQMRLHPARTRVELLAGRHPASWVAFDLLALGDDDLRDRPFAERRAALAEVLAHAGPPVHITPATGDPAVARDWFHRFEGAGLDGVIAKAGDSPYEEGRRGWWKAKHTRTADCVVAGFRLHRSGDGVGSLLLGLYGPDGRLHHMGVAASFSAARRRCLSEELEPHRCQDPSRHPWADWVDAEAHGHRALPGAPSRWSAGRDQSWVPLRPELVAEVAYDQLQHGRFRATTRFVRWRPDRDPATCTTDQLRVVAPAELARLFGPHPPPGS